MRARSSLFEIRWKLDYSKFLGCTKPTQTNQQTNTPTHLHTSQVLAARTVGGDVSFPQPGQKAHLIPVFLSAYCRLACITRWRAVLKETCLGTRMQPALCSWQARREREKEREKEREGETESERDRDRKSTRLNSSHL